MTQSSSNEHPSRLQKLADFAGLIFRAMGSEMGQSSEEVIREERKEKSRLTKRQENHRDTESTKDSE